MNQSNNILRAAVAMCFGAMVGQAHAVLDLTPSTPTGTIKVAKENASNVLLVTAVGQSTDIKVAVPTGYAVTAANPLYVKLNLTGGASFVANPTLGCGTAAVANAAAGTLQLGGAGTSFAVYTIASTDTTVSGTCTAAVGNITLAAGQATVGLSATVEYKNGLNNTVTGVLANYVTFTRGMTATVNSAAGSVVVDATSGSDNFDPSTSNKGASLALLGDVQWTQIGSSAADLTNAANVSAGDVITTAFVTVSGPAIAAALAANGNSGVFLQAGLAAACTTRSYTVSASATNSVTFNNVSLTDISAGVSVCLNVSGGTTVIGVGQMTATVSGTAKSSVTADFSATTGNALETLTSNGTTLNAYMVNASTSAAKTSILRLINTGAVSATFTATAYAEDLGVADGNPVAFTTLGTANSTLGTVAAGGALNLTSAQLESKLGFTPSATGSKYRVVISAGTNSATILNYTKDTATGAIVLSQ